jgi:REP element-mobilizing transposase RayT
MMEKFQNKYRIPSTRLQGYDYGSHGLYFVTICTKNRECYFGNIVETHHCASNDNTISTVETGNCPSDINPIETHNCASLRPTTIGQIAIDYWNEIPKHYPFVELDEFVVMPNHIHGILFFNRPDKMDWTPNQFGVQSQNLGAVIRAFKSTTKRYANQNNIEFEWQSRYHDRIIRNEKELNAIRQYIIDNPLNWAKDVLNVTHVETGNCPSDDDTIPTVETHNRASLHHIIEQETENLLKEIVG